MSAHLVPYDETTQTHLQLVQVTIELLEPLEQRHKIGRSLRISHSPRLNDSLLIDQSPQP